MKTSLPTLDDVLDFWFREIPESAWWEKNPAFDRQLQQRFGALYAAARQGELYGWRRDIHGRLAEVIVLDQFARNFFRDSGQAFAGDSMALVLAQEAVATGEALELPPHQRAFLYMPYMHSESLAIHEQALLLFAEPGLEFNLDFEKRHKAIIDRFGRYPHRNAVLGRESTPEELAFLQTPGSSF
ncbi:MAG TPA: DUF924 family protein [Moraxellaceae bacterium]